MAAGHVQSPAVLRADDGANERGHQCDMMVMSEDTKLIKGGPLMLNKGGSTDLKGGTLVTVTAL